MTFGGDHSVHGHSALPIVGLMRMKRNFCYLVGVDKVTTCVLLVSSVDPYHRQEVPQPNHPLLS
jgi:hypothetical protein